MSDEKAWDIAHVMFLEMIETFINSLGGPAVRGHLIRTALRTADKIAEAEYESLDDFSAAVLDMKTSTAKVEGKAQHLGNGLFGLPKCPFAESIANYKSIHGKLPESYVQVTEDYNKPSRVAEEYAIGQGAGVSPFCAIHQPLRSALAKKIKIGGKTVKIYALGCKSGLGVKAISDAVVKQAGFTLEQIDRVLDDHMCCYCVVL